MKERALAWSIVICALLAVGVFSTACGSRAVERERIENISRVMMNDPGRRYTFLIENPESDRILERQIKVNNVGDTPAATWRKDVSADQKMWAELTTWKGDGNTRFTVEVHIHDVSDIEGGGWNHGKFGRGTTSVVQ